ncbi:hypothetical protein ACN20G_30880 (plasmid) [Streptomyces sp. BI20]|uniref:hypothetical protein n=1 Tax=Streptomyces sp. BI20 TaxID=3403460 RepID=UPI003C789AD8
MTQQADTAPPADPPRESTLFAPTRPASPDRVHRLPTAPPTRTRADADADADADGAEAEGGGGVTGEPTARHCAQHADGAGLVVVGVVEATTPALITHAHAHAHGKGPGPITANGGRAFVQSQRSGRIGHPETSGGPSTMRYPNVVDTPGQADPSTT